MDIFYLCHQSVAIIVKDCDGFHHVQRGFLKQNVLECFKVSYSYLEKQLIGDVYMV